MGRKSRRLKISVLMAFGVICSLLLPAMAMPAAAAAIVVQPGESIQAAIDAAPSGSTIVVRPGTYHENLLIDKDGITLKGSGAGRTILEPPETAEPFCGAGNPNSITGGGAIGICITDANFEGEGEPTANRTVSDVHISGFTVRNFSSDGIVFFGTENISTAFIEAANNEGYGIAAFVSSHESHIGNRTYSNHEAGLYVGDSPEANALLTGNTSYNNVGSGIFLRDASVGNVVGNNVYGNCIGIWILNTGGGTGAMNWVLTLNKANENNLVCPDEEGGPPLSGLGIFVAGGDHNTIVANTTNDNVPDGDSLVSGGIVLFSTADFGGATEDNNKVIANSAHGNEPVDLFWDQMGEGNIFLANHCDTSDPAGLCH